MSDFLDKFLPGAVLGRLAQLYSAHATVRPDYVSSEELHKRQPGLIKGLHPDMPNPSPPEEEIDQTIKDAFMEVDSFLVNSISQGVVDKQFPKEEAARLLSFAHTGSCALVGIYNNVKRTLKVALTGDSRAVLGRRVALKKDTYAYETHVLSADQNGYNPHEVERLETAHPGEEIFKNERMLGGGISRAFGNAAYKLSLEIQQRLHEEYLGDPPRSDCLTPPYFTAEPVITTTTIRKGDFVVLASDGLWDCLTNEEVVGLVGLWLETRGEEVKIGKGQGIGEGEMVMVPSGFHSSGKDHRIGVGKGKGIGWSEGSDGGKTNKEDGTTIWERTDLPVTSLKPDETQMYKSWQATKRFINVDDNAAVHLARSALGGADKELTETLLQLLPPRSRRFRDDISILVVFFD